MNGNTIKTIALYAIGAAIGGGIAYLVVDYILSNQEVKEVFPEVDEGTDQVNPDVLSEEMEWIPGPMLKKKDKKKLGVDYSTIRTSHVNKENLEKTVQDFLSRDPIVISVEEYAEKPTKNYFNKSLIYYEKDDILTDEHDTVISNPEKFVGDALLHFGDGSGDPDIVYVRNKDQFIDYEISMLHKSYSEEVLGKKLEEKPKTNKRNRHTRKMNLEEDNGSEK